MTEPMCLCGKPAVPSLAPFETTPMCADCIAIYEAFSQKYNDRYREACAAYDKAFTDHSRQFDASIH